MLTKGSGKLPVCKITRFFSPDFVIYKMVCKNEITLKDAQEEMASDWIAAYKKIRA